MGLVSFMKWKNCEGLFRKRKLEVRLCSTAMRCQLARRSRVRARRIHRSPQARGILLLRAPAVARTSGVRVQGNGLVGFALPRREPGRGSGLTLHDAYAMPQSGLAVRNGTMTCSSSN